jgi:serine protease inhibitor ecotin
MGTASRICTKSSTNGKKKRLTRYAPPPKGERGLVRSVRAMISLQVEEYTDFFSFVH